MRLGVASKPENHSEGEGGCPTCGDNLLKMFEKEGLFSLVKFTLNQYP
jgi:hypothetical protein